MTAEIFLEHNADERVAIASITKIMTALVTIENTRPNERVRGEGPGAVDRRVDDSPRRG